MFDISTDRLLSIKDAIEKLCVSKSTFLRMRKGYYPNIKVPEPILHIGKSPRWSEKDILELCVGIEIIHD